MSEYYFAAGEMTIKEKKVHANPDRGVLRFYINNETQLLSMKWENLDKKTSNEEIIITAGDWFMKKLSTKKGCPFYIQNTSYADDKYSPIPIFMSIKNIIFLFVIILSLNI